MQYNPERHENKVSAVEDYGAVRVDVRQRVFKRVMWDTRGVV
jgi:hypothetical protein